MKAPLRTVTQKDVAVRAGISRSMVALSLSGHPKIAESTRQRVLEAARELGYQPEANQGARALIGRRHGKRVPNCVIAIMLPVQNADMLITPFFRDLMIGMGAEADAIGVDLCYLDVRKERPVPRLLVNGGVDSVIALSFSQELADLLVQNRVPMVGLTSEAPAGPAALPDGYDGMYRATRHLLELGHRHIGFISHPLELAISRRRHDGWQQAMRESGVYRSDLEECSLLEMRKGPESLEVLLARVPDLTAVVCYNDLVATDVICALHLKGLRVPEDMSVTGFDDTAAQEEFEPGLTSLAYDRHLMGRRAVSLAVALATGDRDAAEPEPLFPVELVVRASTGPAAQK